MSEKIFGAAPDPIRDALIAADAAATDAYEDDLDHAGIAAAAVVAFLRALPATISIQTGSGHLQANMSGFAELATEVERAARKGKA